MEGEKKINERINNVEKMIKRARKMEDLMDYQSLLIFPDVRLPPKFKMLTLDKFDGTGCTKSHLKMYMRALQPLGATEELLAQMFQNTLSRAALRSEEHTSELQSKYFETFQQVVLQLLLGAEWPSYTSSNGTLGS